MNVTEFIEAYFKGERRNKRTGGMRYYSKLQMDENSLYSFGTHFPLAVETEKGEYILNGDVYSSTTSQHQSSTRYLAKRAHARFVEIPFSVLDTAEIPVRELEIMALQEAKTRIRKVKDPATGEVREVEEHLLGASLVRFLRSYYLSSTDRGAHWGFGYFLTELPIKVKSTAQAFNVLKPEFVKKAEKSKKDVKRQGEWFFVPFGNTRKLKKLFKKKSLGMYGKQVPLSTMMEKGKLLPVVSQNGNNLHHRVRDCVQGYYGELYVRGTVRHTENEHRMINLRELWHCAVPNKQVRSWSGKGRVD